MSASVVTSPLLHLLLRSSFSGTRVRHSGGVRGNHGRPGPKTGDASQSEDGEVAYEGREPLSRARWNKVGVFDLAAYCEDYWEGLAAPVVA